MGSGECESLIPFDNSYHRFRIYSKIQKAILWLILLYLTYKVFKGYEELEIESDICPIGETIRPSSFINDNSTLDLIVNDPDFRILVANRLSKAIQFPTVVNDDYTPPNEDIYKWESFEHLLKYFEAEFPLVYKNLKVERINKFGLLYTWESSNNLKPILLTGHTDVVPIDQDTRDKWKYEPFSGYFDGENIWGRGSSDCKSIVIATLTAMERLLLDKVKPERTVLIAFGFDEEVGGSLGAAEISKVLLERYGKDSIYSLIDEGGNAISTIDNRVFAVPSIGEKGSINLKVSLNTPGGHSSVPPIHTSIGLISRVIKQIEDNPFEPVLNKGDPTLTYLQCVAKHSNKFDKSLIKDIFKASYDKFSNLNVLKYLDSMKEYKYTVRTSQAIDVIKGGVKSNALPEYSEFIINHRVSLGTSIDFTINKIIEDIKLIANEFQLGVYYNEELIPITESGYFNITVLNKIDPAPITPTSGLNWDIFAGSIKHIIEDFIYPNLTEPSVVAPNLNTGNTDTEKYWDLTNNIYRYRLSTLNGILYGHTHGVNERTTINNQLYLTAFVYEYIRNVFEYDN